MIVGVTHLAMEADLRGGILLAESLGFKKQFEDDLQLASDFEKIDSATPTLPLAVLGVAGSIELEVVSHSASSGCLGAYTAVFGCGPPPTAVDGKPEARTATAIRRAGLLNRPVSAWLPILGRQAWFDGAPTGASGVAGILCEVGDLRLSVAFWTRFANAASEFDDRAASDEASALVTVCSRLGGPNCRLLLVGRAAGTHYAMNDIGFPSIGVLSTAVAADCDLAVSLGAVLRSEPVTMTVNGVALTLALIEGPSGNPIELIGLPKRPTRGLQI